MLGNRVITGARKESTPIWNGDPVKSIVFDFSDNWGNLDHMGVREIYFYSNNVRLNITLSDFSIIGTDSTGLNASYQAWRMFNTSLGIAQTGPSLTNEYRSGTSLVSNNRIIIVLNVASIIDEIRVINSHDSGADTNIGVRNVIITFTQDTLTNSDNMYGIPVPGGVTVSSSEWAEHVGTDTVDIQTVWTQP